MYNLRVHCVLQSHFLYFGAWWQRIMLGSYLESPILSSWLSKPSVSTPGGVFLVAKYGRLWSLWEVGSLLYGLALNPHFSLQMLLLLVLAGHRLWCTWHWTGKPWVFFSRLPRAFPRCHAKSCLNLSSPIPDSSFLAHYLSPYSAEMIMTLKCRHNSKKLQLFVVMSLPNAEGTIFFSIKGLLSPLSPTLGTFA